MNASLMKTSTPPGPSGRCTNATTHIQIITGPKGELSGSQMRVVRQHVHRSSDLGVKISSISLDLRVKISSIAFACEFKNLN